MLNINPEETLYWGWYENTNPKAFNGMASQGVKFIKTKADNYS